MTNALWHYTEGYYKAYTEDINVRNLIKDSLGYKVCNTYFNPNAWDIVVPSERLPEVKHLLRPFEFLK